MRRTRGPDDGSVAVELVEVGHDVDPSDALADPAGSGRGPGGMPDDAPDGARPEPPARRRRALWWVGVGVIAALAVAVVSVNVVDARREAARRDALAELPWVLPSLSDPLQEVWRAPGGSVVAEGAGVLVMAEYGSVDEFLVAVDRESGAVVWERAGHRESCWAFTDPRRASDQTTMELRPESDLLVCQPSATDTFAVDATGTLTYTVEGVGGEVVGRESGDPARTVTATSITENAGEDSVELVDVATGRTVGSIPVEGTVIGSEVVGGDVVVTSILADGSLIVMRAAVRTGEPVWTYRSEPGRIPPASATWAYVDVDVVLIEGEVSVAVSLETGSEVPVPDTPNDPAHWISEMAAPLRDGSVAHWEYEPTTGRPRAGRVVEADGSTRFAFEGEPWGPAWTDGSAAGVFVVRQADTADDHDGEGRLVGLDLATGDQLWSVPDAVSSGLFQIDGLAVAAGVKTSVIDVRSGHQLWERPFSDEVPWVPLTDGDTVLMPERAAGGDGLAAIDLRTGTKSWWMPVSGPVNDLRVEDDGLVLLLTDSEIVAYR